MPKSVDIRDEKDIPQFESMLQTGPITIVLVYADWCGHCTSFKKNIWSKLKSMNHRKLPLASVHYDQFPKTSLADAKLEGYPSVLVVGTDKKPAEFNGTNAMPNHNDLKLMQTLVSREPASVINSLTPIETPPLLTPEATRLRAPEITADILPPKGLEEREQRGGARRPVGLIHSLMKYIQTRRVSKKKKRSVTRNRKH